MKQLKINTAIELIDFGEQLQLKLRLNQVIGIKLCMELLLLKENLVKAIEIQFENFSFLLKISADNYSYFESMNKNIFKGLLSVHGLDYILHYILMFYRDGIAEAEHIDIEFSSSSGKEYTWTIYCEKYLEYSEDEIRRLLE